MPETSYNFSQVNEKAVKLARTAAAVLALGGLAALKPSRTHEANPQRVKAAYLETDLAPASYNPALQHLNLGNLNRLILAFDTADNSGQIEAMPISVPVKKIVGKMAVGSDLMIAIGGENASPAGWKAALKHPDAFVASTKQAVKTVSAEAGRKVDGIDIDFEFPSTAQSARLVALMQKLRQGLPGEKLTMAIPPTDYNRGGFDFEKLKPLVDDFNVMAYEFHGPWEKQAGDLASGTAVIQSIEDAIQEIGAPQKIVVGFPGYGYIYQGAKKRGDTFSNATTVNYNQLPQNAVKDDSSLLASEAVVNGSWVSVESPNMIRQTYADLGKKYPNVAGAFYWQLPDLVEAHLDAVQ